MSDFVKNSNLPSYEEATYSDGLSSQSGEKRTPNVPIHAPYVQQHQTSASASASAPPPPHPMTGGASSNYGAFESTPTSVQVPINVQPQIVIIGGCPACRIGILEDSYPLLALCCAIVFFPVGILCCLALKSKRCTNCGMEF